MSTTKARARPGLAARVGHADEITQRIHIARGERVMLDEDLAELYYVTTSALNQAVARNRARFPADFAFRISASDVADLKSRSVISIRGRGGRRRSTPLAFTEQGVAMLSSILRSPRAIAVNILIMRTFVYLRRAQGQYIELRQRIEDLFRRVEGHDEILTQILQALDALQEPPSISPRPVGFRPSR